MPTEKPLGPFRRMMRPPNSTAAILLSYGVDEVDIFRRADRVLRGDDFEAFTAAGCSSDHGRVFLYVASMPRNRPAGHCAAAALCGKVTADRMQANGGRSVNAIVRIAGVALFISLIAGSPGNAQFWGGWGNWGGWGGQPQRQPQPRVPRPFNRFRTFFHSPHPQVARERQEPADYASAPGPQKKPDPSAANRVVVVGDGMADWLAYGLEETFAENPEFTILRRHRTTSGLIRYDPRRDVEWHQVIKGIIAADKPKFIAMMIGINDRQPIRERAAAPPRRMDPGKHRLRSGRLAQILPLLISSRLSRAARSRMSSGEGRGIAASEFSGAERRGGVSGRSNFTARSGKPPTSRGSMPPRRRACIRLTTLRRGL